MPVPSPKPRIPPCTPACLKLHPEAPGLSLGVPESPRLGPELGLVEVTSSAAQGRTAAWASSPVHRVRPPPDGPAVQPFLGATALAPRGQEPPLATAHLELAPRPHPRALHAAPSSPASRGALVAQSSAAWPCSPRAAPHLCGRAGRRPVTRRVYFYFCSAVDEHPADACQAGTSHREEPAVTSPHAPHCPPRTPAGRSPNPLPGGPWMGCCSQTRGCTKGGHTPSGQGPAPRTEEQQCTPGPRPVQASR